MTKMITRCLLDNTVEDDIEDAKHVGVIHPDRVKKGKKPSDQEIQFLVELIMRWVEG